jgi:hypothetical protein
MRAISLLVLALSWPMTHAPALADVSERESLAAERRSLNERSAADEQACRARFLVNDCVAKVRAQRREALRPLRERELQIDDAERHQRALDRETAREARRDRPVPVPRAASQPGSAAHADRSAASAAQHADAPRHADNPQSRAAEAAARAHTAEMRAQEAHAAQANVARRIAERGAAGKKSTPLPTPSASEAAR